MSQPCRILSLDGGGVRVLAQAILLGRLFKQYPELYNSIDIFAGTSAGALLALALAEKGEDGLAIFTTETITKMFQRSYSWKIWPSEGITASEYSNRAMEEFLGKQFGSLSIGTMQKQVFVPAFKLSSASTGPDAKPGRWHPAFFSNIGDETPADLVKDVALRTTAAPTYFPIFQNYADGAVFANSPAALTITHCKKKGIKLANIRLLSLSGGSQSRSITEENSHWGVTQWANPLVDLLVDSNVYTANVLCEELLDERYCRYQLELAEEVPLDGTDKLAILIEAAEKADLEPIYQWLQKIWF